MPVRHSALAVLLVIGFLAATPAPAGIIAASAGDMIWYQPLTTPKPNNDNVRFSPNVSDYEVDYLTPPIQGVQMHDVQFRVANSGGVTEYSFWGDAYDPADGPIWIAYSLQLGFGTGDQFVPATLAGLDFDTPDRDSGTNFDGWTPRTWTDNYLYWVVTMFPDSTPSAFHDIDVPDLGANVPDWARTADGGYWFTVRSTAFSDFSASPEPASLALLGFSLVALTGRRRHA
jgi:hypothetical protein